MSQKQLTTEKVLEVGGQRYHYHALSALAEAGVGDVSRLPMTLKIVLENLLRNRAAGGVTDEDITVLANWQGGDGKPHAITYMPARVLMQDFTGVPAVVDLTAMRDAMADAGKDPAMINPKIPVDLVIDHSVQVDVHGRDDAYLQNTQLEVKRNQERYQLLRWAQGSYEAFQVVPPGTGICHQVNLEYLAKVVQSRVVDGKHWLLPDTLVGTDSHTTMINGLGVLGWGVGGIEAEAAMLGQSISILIPKVVGFELCGCLPAGVTATDLVLTVTEMLRSHGVVGKFVEFYGEGMAALSLADRATLANMAPEYGATCGYFPVDQVTLDYLALTGRETEVVAAYCRAQGLWRDAQTPEPVFSERLTLDLATVVPCVAGPKRPQDRVPLPEMPHAMSNLLEAAGRLSEQATRHAVSGECFEMGHGDVVIAAITSCTNTSNPAVMLAAGLVAERAVALGLQTKPWVKTSLAPGSKVVTDYLKAAGLQKALDTLGFQRVGYGCTTCIGNSGPLSPAIAECVAENDLVVSSVLSGNRNFEGRIHPQVKASWLASPPLVVLYALAGNTQVDLTTHVFGQDAQNRPITLQDLWPSAASLEAAMAHVSARMFRNEYTDVFKGDAHWQALTGSDGMRYAWDDASTYIRKPAFFEGVTTRADLVPIEGARLLAVLGDSITTDHISPAGAIKSDSPAGAYLRAHGVDPLDFNSYGARRGNHEVMMRGTFANIRLRNEMLPGSEGAVTRLWPSGETTSIFEAAMAYRKAGDPCVVVAGKEYGTGSSRDWAAKGPFLLGVRAVIAESFERIHRSNLVGMGILPLVFQGGDNRHSLKLQGDERIDIAIDAQLKPGANVKVRVTHSSGETVAISCLCRLDTAQELAYFRDGGVLRHVLRKMIQGEA